MVWWIRKDPDHGQFQAVVLIDTCLLGSGLCEADMFPLGR